MIVSTVGGDTLLPASQRANLKVLSRRALDLARGQGLTIVTAESCTAGMLAALLAQAPGAADHLHGGFVAYTKANKTRSLGVKATLLAEQGAVSADVAVAMAEGALAHSPAQIAVSITGVAGPEPDEDGNPIGLVFIAVARQSRPTVRIARNYGDLGRDGVCNRAMEDALHELIRTIIAAT